MDTIPTLGACLPVSNAVRDALQTAYPEYLVTNTTSHPCQSTVVDVPYGNVMICWCELYGRAHGPFLTIPSTAFLGRHIGQDFL
jgi:hypothetical protein